MRKYEALFILVPHIDEETKKGIIKKFEDIVNADGQVTKVEEMGNKKLAYEIQKLREGYFVLLEFNGNTTLPKELERNFRITDEVIRYVISNVEK